MTSTKRYSSRLLPAAGAATLAATAVAGWAPLAPSASAAPSDDANRTTADTRALDGTYESCSAYFGFGKTQEQAMDVVEFDVADRNGADGVDHRITADTHVVLVLTNAEGETLECLPEEITEAQWDDEMDQLRNDLGDVDLPAWPGPGRYAYPTLVAEPFLEDFGEITAVGFRVAGIPDGHTLESPVGVTPLTQHHTVRPWQYYSSTQDPRLLDLVADELGTQARADLIDMYEVCEQDDTPAEVPTDAVRLVLEIGGFDADLIDEGPCWALYRATGPAAYVLATQATAAYQERIVLALPEDAATTTTVTGTSVVADPAPPAAGAAPIRGTAAYAG